MKRKTWLARGGAFLWMVAVLALAAGCGGDDGSPTMTPNGGGTETGGTETGGTETGGTETGGTETGGTETGGTETGGTETGGTETGGTEMGGTETGGTETGGTETYSYSACDRAMRVGGFWAGLEQPGDASLPMYTTVAGLVSDGIIPTNIPETLMSAGECTLVQGRNLFCNPECAFDETCGEDGMCMPLPTGQALGDVDVSGLADGTVAMSPRMPKNNYQSTGSLMYPGFAEGAVITLQAAGGAAPGFSLVAEGVAPLVINEDVVALQSGAPTIVTWNAPAQTGRSRVVAELNISLHGGDPVRIECDAEDDGSLEIPAALVTELLTYDYSGFPAITLTRQTADSIELPWGCADFRAYSSVQRHPVSIPGLTSCNESQMTCGGGQTCNLEVMRCE